MKWDNLLLEGGTPEVHLRGQYQLAMYAVHLGTGQSIYCRQIKATTVENYLYAVATFLAGFESFDFRKDEDGQTRSSMGSILRSVLEDLRKYEGMPNRREPYDLDMHKLAKSLVPRCHPDTLLPALVDGFEQGLCTGYRLSEWAQPAGRSDFTRPQLNHLVSAELRTRAIVPEDIRARTLSNHRARGLAILDYRLVDLGRLWIRFRTQKNGNFGEEKLFTRNPSPGGICCVAAVYRALARFKRLKVLDGRIDSHATPLSIYWDAAHSSVRAITSVEIETFMRKLAMKVYHLHPDRESKELSQWSAHSLRVGACVVLHAMGFPSLDIQWILRWKSMAFVAYLRNVAILADRQHRALDRAAAMPHIV